MGFFFFLDTQNTTTILTDRASCRLKYFYDIKILNWKPNEINHTIKLPFIHQFIYTVHSTWLNGIICWYCDYRDNNNDNKIMVRYFYLSSCTKQTFKSIMRNKIIIVWTIKKTKNFVGDICWKIFTQVLGMYENA